MQSRENGAAVGWPHGVYVVPVMADRVRGATPADQEAWAKFRRKLETMKPGTWLRMEWARPRHGKHHRKFFALLQLVAENSETYDTVEKALVAVKLVTGYCDPVIHPETGELLQIPKSISYDAMEQDEFDALNNTIRRLTETWGA